MKYLFLLPAFLLFVLNANSQNVGIGINSPQYPLHVHTPGPDAAILITNFTTSSLHTDGLRLRISNLNGFIDNLENGDISISTNKAQPGLLGIPEIMIKPSGAVGIGTNNPNAKLEVAGQVKITGGSPGVGKVLTSDATGLASWTTLAVGGQWTTSGNNIYNANSGSVGIGVNPSTFVQLHVRRDGALSAAPGQELGAFYSENGNINTGSAVYGISGSQRGGASGFAGVTGYNILSGTDRFGVIGLSNGTSAINALSAGVGGYGDYGVLGYSTSNTGAGIIAQHGSGRTALEINNGFIKVSGTNKTAFTITGTELNTSGYILTLNYPNPLFTDILLVTHNFSPPGLGTSYHNIPVGVFWTGTAWAIFSEDTATPMLGKSFNVLVIKQ